MTTPVMKTRPSGQLSLRDKLSHLTFIEAAKLLGPEGKKLIQKSGNLWNFKLEDDVYLGDDLFRLRFPGESSDGPPLVVSLTLMAEARNRLHWNCTRCDGACEHVGAAFSLILEEKTGLGLAVAPPERVAIDSLSEAELIEKALAERSERAKVEKMKVVSADAARPWTDYTVTNRLTGKSYRVALRGLAPGESFCSCPDFRTNTLGTCKHVLHVIQKIKRKFTRADLRRPYRRKHIGLHLRYDREVTLRLLLPEKMDEAVEKVVGPLRDRAIEDLHDLMPRLAKLQKLGHDVTVYPDAEELIQQRLVQERLRRRMAEVRRDPANHPLRTTLLKAPLLPYQLDGVAFAAGAGRAILADDMGLGKTIQGVGAAELLAREAEIKKVLVICPASLKSQWRAEIHRFCQRDVQLIGGAASQRGNQYSNECFFTICNYEQVLDLPPRTTEIVRIVPTDEQREVHDQYMQVVATIVRKKFISEMDLLRLQKSLLMCRMSADGTYLVNKQKPGWSSKLEYLDELFERLFDEQGRKVVLFSEWTTMLDLIEPLLKKRQLDFVRLDGGVPQKRRKELVHKFQSDPDCKLFITTNAGSVGLNLQAANTVINVDLPWNPAVLEQRIARAHRMGQTQSVQVYVLVTEETIEDNLLATIAAKKDLALAALDSESDVDRVDLSSGMEELKSRLEILLGAKPEAPIDETVKQAATEETHRLSEGHRERVAAAGGELLGAAFKFLGTGLTANGDGAALRDAGGQLAGGPWRVRRREWRRQTAAYCDLARPRRLGKPGPDARAAVGRRCVVE